MSDYISREAARKAILPPPSADFMIAAVMLDAYDRINAIPAADVAEVRHGRWVAGPMKMWGWKCTACGAFSPVNVKSYKFCPGCGAKMEGKK